MDLQNLTSIKLNFFISIKYYRKIINKFILDDLIKYRFIFTFLNGKIKNLKENQFFYSRSILNSRFILRI